MAVSSKIACTFSPPFRGQVNTWNLDFDNSVETQYSIDSWVGIAIYQHNIARRSLGLLIFKFRHNFISYTEGDFLEYVAATTNAALEVGIIVHNTYWTSSGVSSNSVE